MPFGEGSSTPFGNHRNTTSRQDAEQPLRSRQNVRPHVESPTPSDLLFSNPQSSFDDFPYPPYSELPFTSLKRRKQSNHNQIVKLAMRAVLLSPVVVLVFWSVSAMIFSKNVNQKSNNKYNNRMNSRGRNNNNLRLMSGGMSQQSNNNLYMMTPQQQQQMYGMSAQQQQQQQQLLVPQMGNNLQMAPLYGAPQGDVINQNMVMNPLVMTPQQQQQMIPQQLSNNNMVVEPQGLLPPLQQQQQQQPIVMMSQGNLVESSATAMRLPMQQQEQPQVLMQQTYLQQQEQPQVLTPQSYLEASQLQIPQSSVEQLPIESSTLLPPQVTQSNPRTKIYHNPPPPPPPPPPMKENTEGATVLYYDPRNTIPDRNGQVLLPSTVYDAQGNPVDLVRLASQNQLQIVMESPLQQLSQPQNLGALTQEEPLDVGLPPMERMEDGEEIIPPEAQMSAADIKKWGESTSQDQSIIVGTVAVMAMLVGALSARRLRHRSFLSACIENEALEDDVAYDAAYSTTMPQNQDIGSSYNTFGRGGWKGDLEKFDV